MTFSVKLALLTSLFSIGGTCWLVNQVARPIVNLPSPPTGSATLAKSSPAPREASAVTRASRLANPTPTLASAGDSRDAKLELLSVRDTPVTVKPPARDVLPPLAIAPPEEPAADHTRLPDVASTSTGAPTAASNPPAADNAKPAVPVVASSSGATPEAELSPMNKQVPGSTLLVARSKPDEASHTSKANDEVLTPGGKTKLKKGDDAAKPAAKDSIDAKVASGGYKVQPGDTLARICKKQLGNDSPETLRAVLAANPELKNKANTIRAGQSLKLPTAGKPSPETKVAAAPEAAKPADAKKAVAAKSDPAAKSTAKGVKVAKADAKANAKKTDPKSLASKKSKAPKAESAIAANPASAVAKPTAAARADALKKIEPSDTPKSNTIAATSPDAKVDATKPIEPKTATREARKVAAATPARTEPSPEPEKKRTTKPEARSSTPSDDDSRKVKSAKRR